MHETQASQPITASRNDVISNYGVAFTQLRYPIDRADFMILRDCGSSIWKTVILVLSISAGAALTVAYEVVGAWMHATTFKITTTQIVALCAPVVLGLIVGIVAYFWSSERRKLCTTIDEHFKKNPDRPAFGGEQ